jgi:membrane protein
MSVRSPGGTERRPPRLSPMDRIGLLRRAAMRNSRIQLLLAVMNDYNAAGGGLLSAGLAFNALFAIIPALLAIVAFLGLLISDPSSRNDMVQFLIAQVPPLEPVARTIVDTLAEGSRIGSIIGIIGVVWGASGFYGALEGATGLLFPGSGGRGIIQQRVRGVIGVVALVGMVLIAVLANAVIGGVASLIPIRSLNLLALASPFFACVAGILVCFIVYVFVPVSGPSIRAARAPAVVAGIGIGLLTTLFGLVAPLLVRGFAALGVIASVFAALVWLNFIFQVLLYGAAWACIRRDRERTTIALPRI